MIQHERAVNFDFHTGDDFSAAKITTQSRAASNSRMRARTKVGISRFFVFSLNARWGLCASWVL